MPQRTLYLESVAGIAGDMFTAAFLDAGLVAPEAVQAVPEALGVPEATVEVTAVQRAGARFTRVRVVAPGGAVEGEPRREGAKDQDPEAHRHHHYPPLARQIEASGLEPRAKAFALEVFRLLAEAEADSHGVPVEKVAFHEVGAVDSVVDVAMAGVCLASVPADRVLASPVKLGRGRIRIHHGTYPVPPPATARLALGMPVAPVPGSITRPDVELSTPTGLAILRALSPEFVEGWPGGRLLAQGAGSGSTDLGDYPNIFRIALLEEETTTAPSLPYDRDRVLEIRTNLDDQTGERTGWLVERLMAMGALDAWVTPVIGKKGRPGTLVTLLVAPDDLEPLADFLLRYSSTFGIRYAAWDRFKLVPELEVRETGKGPVSFKVGRTLDGETLKEKPELEDLKRIWEEDPGFEP
jgi:uncharacterized protein (TIGR00299 family) protein